jgi:hypothetical protein
MRGYKHNGKQVLTADGEHFADAVSPLAALLVVSALNFRKHHPVIDGAMVVCSRCRNELPHDGGEPCVPRTPRCKDTPDMFGGDGGEQRHDQQPAQAAVRPVQPRKHVRTRRAPAVRCPS